MPIKEAGANYGNKTITKSLIAKVIEEHFHDLRHINASYLLKNGILLNMIQKWLGHADLGTAANIYPHIDTEMNENTAKQ